MTCLEGKKKVWKWEHFLEKSMRKVCTRCSKVGKMGWEDSEMDAINSNRIYHHFVQGQGNPPECQRFAVHDEACLVLEVAYLWHEGGFPCPCTKWWLIIFLLSPLLAVRKPLFYLRNYYRTFSDHKTAPTRRRVIVKIMTSLYDHHFRFVHNGLIGDNPLETSFWILIKRMDIRVWGRRKAYPCAQPSSVWGNILQIFLHQFHIINVFIRLMSLSFNSFLNTKKLYIKEKHYLIIRDRCSVKVHVISATSIGNIYIQEIKINMIKGLKIDLERCKEKRGNHYHIRYLWHLKIKKSCFTSNQRNYRIHLPS